MFSNILIGRLPPKNGSDSPETWPKRVSDDPRRFIFSTPKNEKKTIFLKIWIGRLPPEHGSDRAESWGKRVSGDPRHFIF